MIIYFLRHANAGDAKHSSKKDDERGLDPEGVEQCYQVARLFSRLDVVPDIIISSPLKRALQTAAMVANEIGYDDKLRVEKCLLPAAKWEDFAPMLKGYSADTVIVVGHSPNLTHFVGRIIATVGNRADIDLKKGGVARVQYDGRRGDLQWLLTPKLIREANAGVLLDHPPKKAPEPDEIAVVKGQSPKPGSRKSGSRKSGSHKAKTLKRHGRRKPLKPPKKSKSSKKNQKKPRSGKKKK